MTITKPCVQSLFSKTKIIKKAEMNKKLYTAIVFINQPSVVIKYRKIGNEKSFLSFIEKKFPTAYKINFYDRESREFSHQVKLP